MSQVGNGHKVRGWSIFFENRFFLAFCAEIFNAPFLWAMFLCLAFSAPAAQFFFNDLRIFLLDSSFMTIPSGAHYFIDKHATSSPLKHSCGNESKPRPRNWPDLAASKMDTKKWLFFVVVEETFCAVFRPNINPKSSVKLLPPGKAVFLQQNYFS